jgi:hypothetical protein
MTVTVEVQELGFFPVVPKLWKIVINLIKIFICRDTALVKML